MGLRYRRMAGVESAPLNEEEILFHPETQKFVMLNETGRFMWTQLAEPQSLHELAKAVSETFTGVTAKQALPDLEKAMRQLEDLEFVVAEAGSNTSAS
jgi:hypothetical protein